MDSDLLDNESAASELRDSAKRRQIIEGAREVFLAQGFDAASMGEIARKAGVSKGTLYVYFDSKERLFEAINTIAADFEKIVVITHIDELKDLFNVRLDVIKGRDGSRVLMTTD